MALSRWAAGCDLLLEKPRVCHVRPLRLRKRLLRVCLRGPYLEMRLVVLFVLSLI